MIKSDCEGCVFTKRDWGPLLDHCPIPMHITEGFGDFRDDILASLNVRTDDHVKIGTKSLLRRLVISAATCCPYLREKDKENDLKPVCGDQKWEW